MFNQQKGFTLLELVAVLAIIGLLAVIILVNYRGEERQSALVRSAHRLAQDLRRAEEMAISSQKTPARWPFEGVFPEGGYGIYFEIDTVAPEVYRIILFADCDGEGDYDDWGNSTSCASATSGLSHSCNETIEELSLEEGIKISALSPSVPVPGKETLYITFIPPDPTVLINGDPGVSSASTTITFDGRTRTITVNKAGLID